MQLRKIAFYSFIPTTMTFATQLQNAINQLTTFSYEQLTTIANNNGREIANATWEHIASIRCSNLWNEIAYITYNRTIEFPFA